MRELKENEAVKVNSFKEEEEFLSYLEDNFPNMVWTCGEEKPTGYIPSSDLEFPFYISLYFENTLAVDDCVVEGDVESKVSDFTEHTGNIKYRFWNEYKNNCKEGYFCGEVKGAVRPYLKVDSFSEKEYLSGDKFAFESFKHMEKISVKKEINEILNKSTDEELESILNKIK